MPVVPFTDAPNGQGKNLEPVYAGEGKRRARKRGVRDRLRRKAAASKPGETK